MSVLTLPEPDGWAAGRRRVGRVTLVVVPLVVAGALFGADQLRLGDHLGAVVSAGLLVPMILAIVALQLVSRGRTSLRASHDPTGTILRPDRTFSTLLLAMCGSFIPLGIVVTICTLTGDLDLYTSWRGRAVAVVAMVFATGTAISGLLTAWRRGGVGYVKLTPAGIDVADIKRTESIAWGDVLAVDDHAVSNKRTRKAVVLRRHDGTEKIIDGADFFTPGGAGLYWMVRHYWHHADDRVELTDGRALDRLGEGRFDVA